MLPNGSLDLLPSLPLVVDAVSPWWLFVWWTVGSGRWKQLKASCHYFLEGMDVKQHDLSFYIEFCCHHQFKTHDQFRRSVLTYLRFVGG